MFPPILATKLHVPPRRPKSVHRARLYERLDEGLHRRLTLISAPAGFGKTTLVAEWIADRGRPVAWLSLDEEHEDPARFLAYLVAALRAVDPTIGNEASAALRSPQPPSVEAVLTSLLNDLTDVDDVVLMLDDDHAVAATPAEGAIAFLVEHLPANVHLILATRVDPALPLHRLRARDQLTELRAADLRFTSAEGADFLARVMGLDLPADAVATLDTRTEGWIAGLQLAALSLQGRSTGSEIPASFSAPHPFVLEYLIEEVLQRQPQNVQTFLLRTSILERLSGPVCDAVLRDPSAPGQDMLTYLDHANLFLVPLDEERRWYRYHHLFADSLRKRLHDGGTAAKLVAGGDVAELHRRASGWFEEQGLEVEAFRHAASAHDVDRAERLIEGSGTPLHFRGAGTVVRDWLESLPPAVLDARPSLRVTYASVLTFAGTPTELVEQTLQAAEAALEATEPDAATRNLVGRIASLRAMQAIPRSQVDTIMAQSLRALEFLGPHDLSVRTAATWTLGLAHQLRGDHEAAIDAFQEANRVGEAAGNTMAIIGASTSLGQVREAQNRAHLAAESYRRVLHWAGDPPMPAACEAHLGLGRVHYAWNDLVAARRHGERAARLASHLPSVPTPVACALLLARVDSAEGNAAGASARLADAERFMLEHDFGFMMPEVAAARALASLREGDLPTADGLARSYELPLAQARVVLAQGDAPAALALLETYRQRSEASGRGDERLETSVLQALAHHGHGDEEAALALLSGALARSEPEGLVRPFVDEGEKMARLLSAAAARGVAPLYVRRLLTTIDAEERAAAPAARPSGVRSEQEQLDEPLTEMELKILRLTAEGLSNQEIADRLYRALSTVKGHNRNIFGKLQVRRRTEAVARARELGLL